MEEFFLVIILKKRIFSKMALTKIRGHHLDSLANLSHLSREDFGQVMVDYEYVTSSDDPLVDRFYQIVRGFSNLRGDVRIVAGESDCFCDVCTSPLRKRLAICPEFDQPNALPAFQGKEPYKIQEDREVARRRGLELGVYSAEQVKSELGIQ